MNKHSATFNHFKKFAKSTLMGMTKEQLISYIDRIYTDWSWCDLACEYQYALNVALINECPNFDVNQFTYDYWFGKEKE